MQVTYFKKVKGRPLFIYKVSGTEAEIADLALTLGRYFRRDEDGTPLFFSNWYMGYQRPLKKFKGRYIIESYELYKAYKAFEKKGHNLYALMDHALSEDLRPHKVEPLWGINHPPNPDFNTSVFDLPTDLKIELKALLATYHLAPKDHFYYSPEKAREEMEQLDLDEMEKMKDAQAEADMNRAIDDETDSWGEDWDWNIR